jgi:putative ABC transport system permease protein
MGSIDINYLSGSATVDLCQALDIVYECGIALAQSNDPISMNNLNVLINEKIKDQPMVYETLVDDVVNDFAASQNYVVEKSAVANVIDEDFAYKFIQIKDTINVPYIHKGALPNALNEIAIYETFATANDLTLGDTLTINNTPYTITGYVYQVDFIFPIFSMSTIQFDKNVQTLVVTTPETMENLDDYLITRYHVQGDLTSLIGEIGYDELMSTDYSRFSKSMQMMDVLFPAELNFRIIALEQEINNASAFINLFLPVFLGLTTLTLILFIHRYIEQNKQDITTFRQLGYTKKELSLGLMTVPILIGFFSVIGYIVALALNDVFFDIYASRYYLPTNIKRFDLSILLYTTIIPMVVINLAVYFKIRHSLTSKKPSYPKIRLFKYTPLKTLAPITLLLLFVGLFIHTGLNGSGMFSDFVEHTKKGNHFTEMINLSETTNKVIPEGYEPFNRENTTIKAINHTVLDDPFRTTLYAIDADTTLKRLINDDISSNQLLNKGIIISDYLSDLKGLNVGDTLSFTIGNATITEDIVGISNELIESNIFLLRDTYLDLYNIDDAHYNGLYAKDDAYPNTIVFTRINYDESIDEFMAVLNISTLILNTLLILGIIIAIYLLILILLDYHTHHQKDIALLMCLGFTYPEIHKKYTINIYLSLLITSLVSIPLTTLLLNQILQILIDTIGFKLILNVSLLRLVLGVVIIHAIFIIYIFIQNKLYDRLNLSSQLKK